MSDELVTIATYMTPLEADLAKLRLEAAGILSFVQDQNAASMNAAFNLFGNMGVRLQVRAEDEEEAIRVLSEDPEEDYFEENEFEPEPVPKSEPVESSPESDPVEPVIVGRACPQCGSDRTASAYNLSFSQFVLSVLMLGIPLFFFRKKTHCSRCGHSW